MDELPELTGLVDGLVPGPVDGPSRALIAVLPWTSIFKVLRGDSRAGVCGQRRWFGGVGTISTVFRSAGR